MHILVEFLWHIFLKKVPQYAEVLKSTSIDTPYVTAPFFPSHPLLATFFWQYHPNEIWHKRKNKLLR